ncbi:bifunctional pyr operon transcriptional regulator/uracil phosphoribosyltransferase PyrR [Jeotgalibaca porci]|uniref:Bifunctional protein PyrR n=2 Tax=Jeotgalibaca porci TaxID=1868793 RepID=A0A6G7WEL7_9LACT|nr:bifunctional pyr operon transcriptional regulator/uracil phosphoribosyltransferase PyrR [Jeotgalibaca porci]NLB99434.1 bifunctional pyr operon transcriptional regulator/uracil phosphoribosyltransferase PyrR [Lactobacillales bacterium]QIK50734.1 bifunctional pyr operon transcriptional regulator/uracil phosphoribosyltransferase PyrR [Jeotgalibaca porci]
MAKEEILIMDAATMQRSLTRVTHEILERNGGTENLILVGIRTRGIYLAERIAQNIKKFENVEVPVGELDITLYRDDQHFTKEQEPVLNNTNIPFSIEGKNVVLVDDVLFTARTIRAGMDAIMDIGRPKRITVAVLVDRGHRELPIKADYVGKNIPTSTSEQISVRITEVDEQEKVTLIKG